MQWLYYRCKSSLFDWKEQRWVRQNLYHDSRFRALDQELLKGPNPYPISSVFPYGETPLRTFELIAKKINLTSSDTFVDLGCGRGRALFFLSHFFGCKTVGIDLTPFFISEAKKLAAIHKTHHTAFLCQDFRTYDFRQVTAIYLYGTTYSDEFLADLENYLEALPQDSRIVTVSAPLTRFQLVDTVEVRFPWGKGELFFHKKGP